MDCFFVFVLSLEYKGLVVSEVFHVVDEYLEVDCDVFLERVEKLNVRLLEGFL